MSDDTALEVVEDPSLPQKRLDSRDYTAASEIFDRIEGQDIDPELGRDLPTDEVHISNLRAIIAREKGVDPKEIDETSVKRALAIYMSEGTPLQAATNLDYLIGIFEDPWQFVAHQRIPGLPRGLRLGEFFEVSSRLLEIVGEYEPVSVDKIQVELPGARYIDNNGAVQTGLEIPLDRIPEGAIAKLDHDPTDYTVSFDFRTRSLNGKIEGQKYGFAERNNRNAWWKKKGTASLVTAGTFGAAAFCAGLGPAFVVPAALAPPIIYGAIEARTSYVHTVSVGLDLTARAYSLQQRDDLEVLANTLDKFRI